MEISILLLLVFALLLGEARSRWSKPALAVAAAPEESDGLVALPAFAPREYSEKASPQEMQFAGLYLNFAGIALLTLGAISYLRISGIAQRVTAGGWLHCCAGMALGVFLSWAGAQAFRRDLRGYAQPLLASGVSILLLTLGASHFYFHLVPAAGFAAGVFATVVWAGLAVLRYDSTLLAASMLGALFLGPLTMHFSLDQMGIVLAYLLAINLATAVVALRKQWDGFLVCSFLGTYGLFFHQFGLTLPWPTLGFLLATYGLFLASGNVFHLWRGSASRLDLWLSLVNPLTFAWFSYIVLLQMPNALSLATYAAVGLIHLGLANAARKRNFLEMAQTNLALGLLFFTAAASFLTYLSDDTNYFALVTLLWLVESVVLLKVSRRLEGDFAPLVRRGSYVAMGLAVTQLVYVVSTMEQAYLVQFPGIVGMLAYFWIHQQGAESREEHLFSNLVLLSALTTGYHTALGQNLVVGAALAPLLLLAYLRFPRTLVAYRWAAPLLATAVTLYAVCDYWKGCGTLFGLAILVGLLTPLCLRSPELEGESPLGALLAALLVLRASLVVARFSPWLALGIVAAVALGLVLLSSRVPRLEPAAAGMGMLLVPLALATPATQTWELAALTLIAGLYGGVAVYRTNLQMGAAAAGGLLVMKLAFLASSGAGGSLLWCLLALGLLARYADVARVIFFMAFIKSIGFDANFIYSASGWELAGMHCPDVYGLALVAAGIGTYALAARRDRDWRNVYSLGALLVFAFQATFVLYNFYGVLETFQIFLSGFWATASLLFIAWGIHRHNKLFRLFGLVVLVSCVFKVYAVDIWVLDAYDKTTTTLVLGSLLMVVSFLYQLNRPRLQEAYA